MDEKRALTKSESALGTAFQDLSDGMVALLVQHLKLLVAESKQDLKVIVQDAVLTLIGITAVALGYTFAWVAAILAVAVFGTLKWTLFVALFAAILHIGIGIYVMKSKTAHMKKTRQLALNASKSELEKSSQWVKQIATD